MYIECISITKSFGQDTLAMQVLNELNFTIEKNDNVAILGSSGSGKSTLLHLIAGLDLPDSGEIIIGNQSITTLNEKQRCLWRSKAIGFIYQFHHLLPEFTLLENVMMPLLIMKAGGENAKQRAIYLLNCVKLGSRLEHKPHELSGGEKQRVAICRALAANPEIILADEPTGNLDVATANIVMDIIFETCNKNNITLITVTHNKSFMQRFDKSYSLNAGRLEYQP